MNLLVEHPGICEVGKRDQWQRDQSRSYPRLGDELAAVLGLKPRELDIAVLAALSTDQK